MRKVDLESGKVLQRVDFDRRYFGEGSCAISGRLYILTWQEHVVFVYDLATFKPLGMLTNTREGWGLTTDGKKLYLSDGSSSIYVMDGDTFEQQGKIKVKLDGKPVRNLNELEWIDGRIWANVYTEDYIVIIDPSSGNVTGVVDCRGLLPDSLRSADTDVLNGIARNDVTGEIYLTGKLWPRMYRVKLEEKK
jgi:glutamine cyclotransferase